jgi:hypothetical protein
MNWSRHLLANIRWRTGCELLIGASAVTYNPHFLYFAFPHLLDEHLGAVTEWPMVPALLIIDSFAPHLRCQVFEDAATHRQGVWILKQHTGNPDEPVLAKLREIAYLHAELPKKSMVLHQVGCWETAVWDVKSSRYIKHKQLWKLNTNTEMLQKEQPRHPEGMLQLLDCGGFGSNRYAFHWCADPVPPLLLIHRQHQQDAILHTLNGLVAGTDGSVDDLPR